jgi:hypothetical protein
MVFYYPYELRIPFTKLHLYVTFFFFNLDLPDVIFFLSWNSIHWALPLYLARISIYYTHIKCGKYLDNGNDIGAA